MPSAVGHEGCFQPDGMVYYMASTDTITPIDLSDPAQARSSSPSRRTLGHPRLLDQRRRQARLLRRHRRRAACSIADTSEVQARKQGAQIKVIGELPTPGNDGQQSTIPITYGGRPYLFDWSRVRRARPARARRGPTASRTSATR